MKDFFVGIDTSSMDLVATVLDGNLVVVAEASSFPNGDCQIFCVCGRLSLTR
jgi:hypothetical protein